MASATHNERLQREELALHEVLEVPTGLCRKGCTAMDSSKLSGEKVMKLKHEVMMFGSLSFSFYCLLHQPHGRMV